MEKVVISGGTGLVGKHLIPALEERNYEVIVLSRSKDGKEKNVQYAKWDPGKGSLPANVIEEADHIINLAGANLGHKRWTKSYKQTIIDSRISSTRLLAQAINNKANNLKTFVSASAINYYGIKRDELITEASEPGKHFLSEVCLEWEKEANQVNKEGVRVVIPRIATIFAKEDGALPQMAKPIRFGIGAPIGPGDQRSPWIHVKDLVKIIADSLQNEQMQGPYVAAAPDPVTNKALTKVIAEKLNKPLIFPNVPIFALKLFIGEFAQVLLTDFEISTDKLSHAGFEFEFPTAEKAVANLLND